MSVREETSQKSASAPAVAEGSLPSLVVGMTVTWTAVAAMMIAVWMYNVSDTHRARRRVGGGALAASVAAGRGGALSGDPRRGREVFNTICIACHGPTGAGVEKLGANLRQSRFVSRKTDAELIDFIKKGRQPGEPNSVLGLMMPPKGGNPALDDKSLKDVVAFIRTLQAEAGVSVAGAN